MGVSVYCKKTGKSIDMGYGGFFNLRNKVSDLVGGEWAQHYSMLYKIQTTYPVEKRKALYKEFDAKTEELISKRKVSVKVVDFLLQSDCAGSIRFGACKQILKVIGDYDDDICYGYAGRKDCAMFRDFKAILQDCVDTKSDLVWD